jgi:hypothetical protein
MNNEVAGVLMEFVLPIAAMLSGAGLVLAVEYLQFRAKAVPARRHRSRKQ